jgi:hypothetical protein
LPKERVISAIADDARGEHQSTGASSSQLSETIERHIENAEVLAFNVRRRSSPDQMRSEDQKTARS